MAARLPLELLHEIIVINEENETRWSVSSSSFEREQKCVPSKQAEEAGSISWPCLCEMACLREELSQTVAPKLAHPGRIGRGFPKRYRNCHLKSHEFFANGRY
jgi:hypothetical protein